MIIWVNGAFGSGKTSVAYELNRLLCDSFVFDPENTGYFLRKNMPLSLQKEDFQDEPLWRRFNVEMLCRISAEYAGVVLVPMTIAKKEYFEELIPPLRARGVRVDHYVLGTSKAVLEKRLRSRMDGKRSWGYHKIEECLRAFQDPVFETVIDTDALTVFETACLIAEKSNLFLQDDSRSSIERWVGRKMTMLRHIRF